jgi:predicted ribosome quality control (RQC) complex YloA/Tae2 family protein
MAEKTIVRIRNKATGRVSVYESESYYDPVKKASRPKRKYLGLEDPLTGVLIPSSGKRGRPKKEKSETSHVPPEPHEPTPYDQALKAVKQRDGRIKQLESHIQELEKETRRYEEGLQQIRRMINSLLDK